MAAAAMELQTSNMPLTKVSLGFILKFCYSLALRNDGHKRIRIIGLRRPQLNVLRFLQFYFSLNRVLPRLSPDLEAPVGRLRFGLKRDLA